MTDLEVLDETNRRLNADGDATVNTSMRLRRHFAMRQRWPCATSV